MSENVIDLKTRMRVRSHSRESKTAKRDRDASYARNVWTGIEARLKKKRSPRSKLDRVPKDDPECGGDLVRISRNFYDILERYEQERGIKRVRLAQKFREGETTRYFERHWLAPKHAEDPKRIEKLITTLNRRIDVIKALAAEAGEDRAPLLVELFKGTWFAHTAPVPALRDEQKAHFRELAGMIEDMADRVGRAGQAGDYFRLVARHRPLPDPRAERSFFDGDALTDEWLIDHYGHMWGETCVSPQTVPDALWPHVDVFWMAPVSDGKKLCCYDAAVLVDEIPLEEHYKAFLKIIRTQADGSRVLSSSWEFPDYLHAQVLALRTEEFQDEAEVMRLPWSESLRVAIYLAPQAGEPGFTCRLCRERLVTVDEVRSFREVDPDPERDDDPDDLGEAQDAEDDVAVAGGEGGPVSAATISRTWACRPQPLFHPLLGDIALVRKDGELHPGLILAPEEACRHYGLSEAQCRDMSDPRSTAKELPPAHFDSCSGVTAARFLQPELWDATASGSAIILGEGNPPYFRLQARAPTYFSPDSAAAYLQANHLYAEPGARWFDDLEADLKKRCKALDRYIDRLARKVRLLRSRRASQTAKRLQS